MLVYGTLVVLMYKLVSLLPDPAQHSVAVRSQGKLGNEATSLLTTEIKV